MSPTLKNADFAYEYGDQATARALFEELAKNGDTYALVRLASMYLYGQGGPVDLEKAEGLLNQAIALGMREAVFQKAYLFRARGDSAGYFRSIREASAGGLLPAQYRLALCYLRGYGVPVDTTHALEIMRAAAKRGHVGAQIIIARHLLRNPLRPFDFVAGFLLYIYTFFRGMYLAFSKSRHDQIR